MAGLGKALIAMGLLLVVIGVVFVLAGRLPWLGNLPGDISIQRERYSLYFPITTSVIISIIISLVLYFFRR